MFKKLYKKITVSIKLLSAVFLFITATASIAVIGGNLYNLNLKIARETVEKAVNGCEFYMESVKNSIINLSKNETIIKKLKEDKALPVTAILNEYCTYSLTINGITLYSLDGGVYTSAKMTSAPTLEELSDVDGIGAFLNNEEKDFLSVRSCAVAKIYDDTVYSSEFGIITYFRKVYDGGDVCGYIAADVQPVILYNQFLSFVNSSDSIYSFIGTSSGYFSAPTGNSLIKDYTIGRKGIYRLRYLVLEHDFLASSTLVTMISLDDYYGDMAIISGAIILVCTLLMLAVNALSKLIAAGIVCRLDNILIKMQSQ